MTFDPNANIAYLRLREKTGDAETIEVTHDVQIDIDHTSAVCGIEFLNANDQLTVGEGGKLVFFNRLAVRRVR